MKDLYFTPREAASPLSFLKPTVSEAVGVEELGRGVLGC